MSYIEFPKFYKHRKCEKYYAVQPTGMCCSIFLSPGIASMQTQLLSESTILELLEPTSGEIFFDKASKASGILHAHVAGLAQLIELQCELQGGGM